MDCLHLFGQFKMQFLCFKDGWSENIILSPFLLSQKLLNHTGYIPDSGIVSAPKASKIDGAFFTYI